MASSVLSTALKEQLSCSICLSVYTDPKTLTCLHSFCLPCLNEMALKTPPDVPLRCPDCQAEIRLPPGASFDDLPNSFYFKRLLELLAIQEPQKTTATCGSCSKNLPLTSFCFDCGQFLCCECVNAHNSLGFVKGHRRVALKQLQDKDVHDVLERPDSCSIEYHEEKLKYFCEDCKTCICQHCALVEHKLHQYVHIKKAADQCKAAMNAAVNNVKAKIPVVQEAITKAEESFGVTEQQIKTARCEVDEQVEHFIRLLRQHKANVISELEDIEQSEKRRYEAKRSDFEVQLAQMKSGVEFVDAAVERNLSNEIINTHDSVIKRCTELAADDKRGNEGRKLEIKYEAFKEFVVTTAELTPGRVLVTGLVDPTRTTVGGENLKEAFVGKQAELVVITRDFQGNLCSDGGDCVKVTITSSTGEAVESTVLNQKNGHYTAQYTPRKVGSCEVTVQTTGQAAAGSPFEVRVRERTLKPLKTFGSYGRGAGQFQCPQGMAVNSRGEVAVADSGNHRVQLFTSDGQHLRTIGSQGSGKGQVNWPVAVAFDHQDRIIVADYYNHRIKILTTTGQHVKTFGQKELTLPLGVCMTIEGNIAVCSQDDKRGVMVFTQDGLLIRQFNGSKRNSNPCDVACSKDKFFVSYASDHSVSVFNREGILLYSFGEPGEQDGQFNYSCGVVVDKSNRVLVCDQNNHRIQVFTTEGQFLQKIGSRGTDLGLFYRPTGITLSPDGQVYVSEVGRKRVQVLLYN